MRYRIEGTLQQRLFTAALALGVLASCESSEPRGLATPGTIGLDGLSTWHAEPTARIGSLDGADDALTRIGPIVISENGELLIAQPQEAHIKVFAADGTRLGTIGGQGRGPGEFQRIDFIGLSGDSIYVSDSGIGRITYFSREGTVVRTVDLATPPRMEQTDEYSIDYLRTAGHLMLPDGSALAEIRTTRSAPVVEGRQIRFNKPLHIPFVRIDAQTLRVDTIGWRVTRETRDSIPVGAGKLYWFTAPFANHDLGALSVRPAGLVIAREDTAHNANRSILLARLTPAGDTAFVRRYSYDPRPVSQEVVQAAARRIAENSGDARIASMSEEFVATLSRTGSIPRYLPAATALTTGQDGSIWLRREELEEATATWIVFDSEGDARGELSLPSSQTVAAVNRGVVVTREEDSLGIPHIVVYRVAAGER